MYVPEHFAETDTDILAGLMRDFSFALLVTARDGSPVGSHIPLHLQMDGDKMTLLKHTGANRALVHCTASIDTDF